MLRARAGETAALRWRDWNRTLGPLTRITIARAIKSVSRKKGRAKTRARKLVPVHPALERVLAAWWAEGWQLLLGRAPLADDLIVPNKLGARRNTNRANRDFGRDLARLKLRERHLYVARHTFITRTQDDGADGAVLRWVTHPSPKSAFDGYTREQWGRLCAEVGRLRIVGPLPAEVPPADGGAATLAGRMLGDRLGGSEADAAPEQKSPAASAARLLRSAVGARGFEGRRIRDLPSESVSDEPVGATDSDGSGDVRLMPSTNGTHLVLQQLAQGIADALDAIARGRLDVAREHLERIQRDLAAGHEVAGSEVPRGS